MTDYTSGPWTVYAEDNDFPGIEAEGFSIIIYGDSDEWGVGVQGRTVKERNANAELIASAPRLKQEQDELLGALVGLLELIRSMQSGGVNTEWYDKIVGNARAIIIQVKGAN